MKKITIVFMATAILMMESCNTQRFYVHGTPGTVITSLDGTKTLAVIGQDGTAKVKLNRKNNYNAFLQAKAPNSNKYVPFALDYKDKARYTQNAVLGMVLALPTIFISPMVFLGRLATKYDYDYLKHQNTNNDIIK